MSVAAAALIPALNEAATIAQVVVGVSPHVAMVLVVDDGSVDDTGVKATRAGASVLRLDRTMGKGAAIRAGLARLGTTAGVTHVLMLDGDLQHLPAEAPLLLEAASDTGAALVVGERRFDRERMPRSRYYANRIGSRALSAFMGLRIADTQCGFRVVRLDALRDLNLQATGYDIETEMLVKIARRGGMIARVPVTAVYDDAASKLRPVRDTTRTCFRAVYYRYIEPL